MEHPRVQYMGSLVSLYLLWWRVDPREMTYDAWLASPDSRACLAACQAVVSSTAKKLGRTG